MPKKLPPGLHCDYDVIDTLKIWGQCVRTKRVRQKIVAEEFCRRVGITRPTLRRLERGDPGVSASTYLAALLLVGMLDIALRPIDPDHYSKPLTSRARPWVDDDDEYF